MKRWFIAGIDTEVGKTVASCALLQAAAQSGKRVAGYKPVASGSELTSAGWRNADALALQQHSNVPLSYEQVNPLTFAEATAPHLVSAEANVSITTEILSGGLRVLEQQADWIVIEGAGGWYTPLSDTLTFADWVVNEQLPVILVVAVRLGCINHALLTVQAIRHSGLPLAGWIANSVQPPGARYRDYITSLVPRINAPLLGEIPCLSAESFQQPYGHYLRLP